MNQLQILRSGIQNPEEIDLDSAPDALLEFAAKWLGGANPIPIGKSAKELVRKVAAQALRDVLARRRVSRVVDEHNARALTEPPAST